MRDKTIDGYRAVAALGVVTAHAASYRFAGVRGLHYAQRLADPLAQTSVQIFFVISGFIITSLLIREREKSGRISISAFYVRRVCRIIPPLATMLLVTAIVQPDWPSLAMASTFTCNIGDCHWYVAHTWSLSVEEQFYLVWPLLLVSLSPSPRLISVTIGAMLLGFLIAPFAWHSNYISFSCIGLGALYASSGGLRAWIEERRNALLWCATAVALLLGPLYLPLKPMQLCIPFLILYLLFATPAWGKAVLGTRPVQMIGLASYSLYLWQQMFLGHDSTLSLWALPLVVAASVILIEQPFIRLGRLFSCGPSSPTYRPSSLE